jgi:GNAT superfamily N-acetyltransferase/catechol 2,3-dioxygenase-like lactoylglutathione lyase family enzyme
MRFKYSVPILYSEDVKRSIQYYTEVLGFDKKWEWDEPATFGGVSKDSIEIFFCEKGQGNPGTWLSIMIDNLDEYYEYVKANGAKIRSAPENMEWGLREMLIEDPDGHMLRFGQIATINRKKGGSFPDEIKIIERIPTVEEYQRLVKSVGWNLKEDKLIQKALKAPLYSVVAEDNHNKVVGCVLLLGDDASFYYIKDMMILPAYQNKKLGTALMQKIYDWIEANAEADALVGLYTGENLAPFYSQFGFRESFGMSRRV